LDLSEARSGLPDDLRSADLLDPTLAAPEAPEALEALEALEAPKAPKAPLREVEDFKGDFNARGNGAQAPGCCSRAARFASRKRPAKQACS